MAAHAQGAHDQTVPSDLAPPLRKLQETLTTHPEKLKEHKRQQLWSGKTDDATATLTLTWLRRLLHEAAPFPYSEKGRRIARDLLASLVNGENFPDVVQRVSRQYQRASAETRATNPSGIKTGKSAVTINGPQSFEIGILELTEILYRQAVRTLVTP